MKDTNDRISISTDDAVHSAIAESYPASTRYAITTWNKTKYLIMAWTGSTTCRQGAPGYLYDVFYHSTAGNPYKVYSGKAEHGRSPSSTGPFRLCVWKDSFWGGSGEIIVDLYLTCLMIELKLAVKDYSTRVHWDKKGLTIGNMPVWEDSVWGGLTGTKITVNRERGVLRIDHLKGIDTELAHFVESCTHFASRFGLSVVTLERGKNLPIPADKPPPTASGLPVTVETPPPE